MIYGELPDEIQYERWSNEIMRHTFVHVRVSELMKTFNYDAHPMVIPWNRWSNVWSKYHVCRECSSRGLRPCPHSIRKRIRHCKYVCVTIEIREHLLIVWSHRAANCT